MSRSHGAWLLAAVAALAAIVFFAAMRGPSPAVTYAQLPGDCALRYTRARTAADTAVADAVIVGRAGRAPSSCGVQRLLVERRRAGR